MQQLSQSIVSGVGTGSLDALLALGIVLIYRMTGVLNFAQAAIGTLAAYVFYSVSQGRPLWLAAAAGLAVAAACGAGSYGIVSGIKSRQYALTSAVATLAIAILLGYIVRTGWSATAAEFPNPFGLDAFTIGEATLAYPIAASIAAATVLAGVIGSFLRWTRWGTMLRAVADEPDAARLCGARVQWLLAGVWAASGMLAAVGAFFAAIILFDPSFLDPYFVASLIAAVLGGLRSLLGAFLAAIVLEISSNLFTTYASTAYQPYTRTFLLVLLIAVLFFAPRRWLAGGLRRGV